MTGRRKELASKNVGFHLTMCPFFFLVFGCLSVCLSLFVSLCPSACVVSVSVCFCVELISVFARSRGTYSAVRRDRLDLGKFLRADKQDLWRPTDHFMSSHVSSHRCPPHPTLHYPMPSHIIHSIVLLPRPGTRSLIRHRRAAPWARHLRRDRGPRQHLSTDAEAFSSSASVRRCRLRGSLDRVRLPRPADAEGQRTSSDRAHRHQIWYYRTLRLAGTGGTFLHRVRRERAVRQTVISAAVPHVNDFDQELHGDNCPRKKHTLWSLPEVAQELLRQQGIIKNLVEGHES